MFEFIIILFIIIISISMARVSYLGCNDMIIGMSVARHGSIGSSSMGDNIIVKRGSISLVNGESYIPGETLSVSLSSNPSQYAIEMEGGATFMSGGKCDGKRKDNNGGSITLPSTGSGTVKIKAIVGNGQVNSVKMLPTITLYVAPTPSPSVAPSGPSPAPTVQPTSPTPQPTIQPTAIPTNSTMSTSIDETEVLSAGIVAAIIMFIVLPLGSFGYYQYQSKKGLTKVAIEV